MNIIEEMRAFAPCFMATPDEVFQTITRWADWLEQNPALVTIPTGPPVKATLAGEVLVTIPGKAGVYLQAGVSYHDGAIFAIMRNTDNKEEFEISEAVRVQPVRLAPLAGG